MKKIQQAPVPRAWRDGPPLIGGGRYERVSSLAKVLKNQDKLNEWKGRVTALGVAQSEDLVKMLAGKDAKTHKKEVNEVVKLAHKIYGANKGRNTGTSIHEITELLDYNTPLPEGKYPAEDVADAYAYLEAVKSFSMTPVAAECFVVNHTVKAAGTFDRLMEHEIGYVVTDIKTGNSEDPAYEAKYKSLEWGIQLATYANALPWDKETLSWEDWGFHTPNLKYGVIWYIPRGSKVCHPITINIETGWVAAKLSRKVLDTQTASLTVKIHEPKHAPTT